MASSSPASSMYLSYSQPLSGPQSCVIAQRRNASKAYCHKNNQNKGSLNIVQPAFLMQKLAKILLCLLEQSFLSQWLSCGTLKLTPSCSAYTWGLQKGIGLLRAKFHGPIWRLQLLFSLLFDFGKLKHYTSRENSAMKHVNSSPTLVSCPCSFSPPCQ